YGERGIFIREAMGRSCYELIQNRKEKQAPPGKTNRAQTLDAFGTIPWVRIPPLPPISDIDWSDPRRRLKNRTGAHCNSSEQRAVPVRPADRLCASTGSAVANPLDAQLQVYVPNGPLFERAAKRGR